MKFWGEILIILIISELIACISSAYQDIKVVDGVNRASKVEDDEKLNSIVMRDEVEGPEALLFLDGLCFETIAAKYFQVTICPFHNVTQRRLSGSKEIVTGIWGSWESTAFHANVEGAVGSTLHTSMFIDGTTQPADDLETFKAMKYEGGDKCAGGEQRAAVVNLACMPAEQFGVSLTGSVYKVPHDDAARAAAALPLGDVHTECSAEGFSPAACAVQCTLHLPLPCEALVASRVHIGIDSDGGGAAHVERAPAQVMATGEIIASADSDVEDGHDEESQAADAARRLRGATPTTATISIASSSPSKVTSAVTEEGAASSERDEGEGEEEERGVEARLARMESMLQQLLQDKKN